MDNWVARGAKPARLTPTIGDNYFYWVRVGPGAGGRAGSVDKGSAALAFASALQVPSTPLPGEGEGGCMKAKEYAGGYFRVYVRVRLLRESFTRGMGGLVVHPLSTHWVRGAGGGFKKCQRWGACS